MVDRVLICCTWGATESSAWYGWLADRIPVSTSVVELAPHPAAALPNETIGLLRSSLGPDTSRTLLVGHGLGGQAILRLLADLDRPVAAFVGVGPWWDITEPWPLVRPWLSSFDYPRARANAGEVRVLLSDHDPYHWSTNAAAGIWKYAMGGEVSVHPGAFDFSAPSQPAVMTTVEEMLG